MGKTAPVALRINPDVDAGTHEKISTGRKNDKFGIPWDEAAPIFELAAGLDGVEPVGVHLHIGSQISRLEPFEAAYRRGIELFTSLRAQRAAAAPARSRRRLRRAVSRRAAHRGSGVRRDGASA